MIVMLAGSGCEHVHFHLVVADWTCLALSGSISVGASFLLLLSARVYGACFFDGRQVPFLLVHWC